jgi:hypothetical protein
MAAMAETDDNTVEILGTSIKGFARNLLLIRGQPGKIAVTAYAGEKSVTVIVSAKELRDAMDRLAPK